MAYRWTDEMREQLTAMWMDPVASLPKIAETFGMDHETVLSKAKALGLGERAFSWRVWTDDLKAEAFRLWERGLSAAQIAKTLPGGFSRNAVIGIVYREYSGGRQRAAAPKMTAPRRTKPIMRSTPKSIPVPKAVIEEVARLEADKVWSPLPGTTPRPFIERGRRMCSWPVGGLGADLLACCESTHAETPYCKIHGRVAFQAPAPGKPRTGNELMRSVRRYA